MYSKYAFLLLSIPVSVNCWADTGMVLGPDIVVPNACVFDNIGVYSDSFVMVPVYEDTIYTCAYGYYLPKASETCAGCPENSYCPGGEYTYSETDDTGLNKCPDGTFAPAGMWQVEQCGRVLHVGDGVVYLRTVKKTVPALNVDMNGDGIPDFFANMTTFDVPMNRGTTRKFKISLGDKIYSVHDDTITVPESDEQTVQQ